ncbi:MAG: acyl carrier protein [Prevotellaceae bacterium]|jgi:acyl carrier protein|nr:acyl carrier protein [Prevotellaceae bacterium]
MNKLKDRIIAVLQKVFELEQIDENASQQTIEKWDSLAHLNLIVALEEEFDISFEPEEIAEMISVQMIINFIDNHLK